MVPVLVFKSTSVLPGSDTQSQQALGQGLGLLCFCLLAAIVQFTGHCRFVFVSADCKPYVSLISRL